MQYTGTEVLTKKEEGAMRVLFVTHFNLRTDDIRFWLIHAQLQVQRTATIAEGLEQMYDQDYDLILIDLHLLNQSEHRTSQRLRSVAGQTPIVICAEDDDHYLRHPHDELDADGYVLCSMDPEDIVGRILESAAISQARVNA